MSYWSRQSVSYTDGATIDAFGRLRVSNPVTLFDSKQLYDKSPLFWDEVAGGGAGDATHSTTDAATTMTVDAAGEYLIRQTKQRFNYQPGKSQQAFLTAVLGVPTSGVEKKVGYYNTSTAAPHTADIDGIYIKQDGTTTYWVIAKNGTETAIPQSSWNIDTMDGNGPSRVVVDWTKTQIFVIDFEWLGVGRVRVGLNIDGATFYVHEFLHANRKTSVYMSSPNHSLRYEIRSTGGTASLVHICGSVTSEGGEQALGVLRHASTAGTHVDANTENVVYAIVGVRLKSTHLDATVRLLNFAIQIQTASDKVEWFIAVNPTVAGTFSYSALSNSAVEAATGATANTVTGGTILEGGFLEAAVGGLGAGSATGEINNALRLGSNIDGTPDTIVLCARPVGGSSNVDIEGALFWRELV